MGQERETSARALSDMGLPSFTAGWFSGSPSSGWETTCSPKDKHLMWAHSIALSRKSGVDGIARAACEFDSKERGILVAKPPAQFLIHAFSLTHRSVCLGSQRASDGDSSCSTPGDSSDCDCTAEKEGTPRLSDVLPAQCQPA